MKAAKLRLNARRKIHSTPLPAVTAGGTSNFFILSIPEHPVGSGKDRWVLKAIHIGTRTVYASALGTVLLNVFKKRGATQTQLVTSNDLETGLAADDNKNIPFDGAITLANRTLQGGDVLYGTIVSNNADATGPAAFAAALTVELDALDVRGEGHFDDDGPFS